MASVTLKDIAQHVGVSHTTVSRVLNGNRRISAGTRSQVLDAIRELEYRPGKGQKHNGSKNNGRQTIQVELVLSHLHHTRNGVPNSTFYMDVMRGVQRSAECDGYVDCTTSFWDIEDTDSAIRILNNRRPHAVIMAGVPDRNIVELLLARGMTVVLADNECEGINVDSVVSDNFGGGAQAAKYLLDKGFRRIGWVGGRSEVLAWRQRLKGVRSELAEYGLLINEHDCRSVYDTTVEETLKMIQDWLKQGDLPPALILMNEHLVFPILNTLNQFHLSCPEDVSIVCFDDSADSQLCDPQPTRFATYPVKIGQKAMQRAIQIVRHPEQDYAPEKIVVPVRLIEASSVKSVI